MFNQPILSKVSSVWQFFKAIDEGLGKYFDTGDSEVRTWFLVRQNTLPFILCGLYVLFVKVIGPAIMKNRKELELRKPMIVFNMLLVLSYIISISVILVTFPALGSKTFCYETSERVRKGDLTYLHAQCFWFIYILKYIEFMDTVFFVLRKKDKLVTNLHVIHHTTIPIVGWILMRTEKSRLQSIPVILNGIVHILMYTYYGLAAVGPQMKKYLWWKKYLTILQMVQFVLILLFVAVIAPMSGCIITKTSLYIDVFCGMVFLVLFYNFYTHTFTEKEKPKDD